LNLNQTRCNFVISTSPILLTMCFRISVVVSKDKLVSRVNAIMAQITIKYDFDSFLYHASGFNHPKLPVVTDNALTEMKWGLIPAWVKDQQKAKEMADITLNAKMETAFEKPSFKSAIASRRCLIPATGFFEFHDYNSKKYPFFITTANEELFFLGGIWESWADKTSGELIDTFSILTTEANSLMAKIHNSKMRMPVIIPPGKEATWLSKTLTKPQIEAFQEPFDESKLKAYPISRLITSRTDDPNTPRVIEPFEYAELGTF